MNKKISMYICYPIIGVLYLLLIVVSFALILLFRPNKTMIYQSNNFKYIKLIDEQGREYASIIGVNRLVSYIVIPTMIDGLEVKEIGYVYDENKDKFINYFSGSYMSIYIHSQIEKVFFDSDNYLSYFDNCGINNGFFGHSSQCILKGQNIESIYGPGDFSADNYHKANVIYYLNNDTDDTFFVDYCENSRILVNPPTPLRSGYEFVGWYTEKACINQWNKNDIVESKLDLYAKWEKVSL